MSELVKQFSSAHWYTAQAQPAHDADLRRARKENLFPSVTTILYLLDKPGLTNWKIEQGILAALTLPRLEGETDDLFAKRAVVDAGESSKKAMALGTLTHDYCEAVLSKKERPEINPITAAALDKFLADFSGVTCEAVLVGNRFAGRCDCFGFHKDFGAIVVDFKTQGTKVGKPVNKYDEWKYQLAAYQSIIVGKSTCMSVVISTTEPGRVEAITYKQEDIDHALRVFNTLVDLFYLIKKLGVTK